MNLKSMLTLHAALALALGIGFTAYGPLMVNFFGAAETPGENVVLFWNIWAFARLFGAALFGLGLVLWSLRSAAAELKPATRRGLMFAQVLANLVALIVALTQQFSVWQPAPGGWVLAFIFLFFLAGYGYLWAKTPEDGAGAPEGSLSLK